MAFSFAMRYTPAFQKRAAPCAICHQTISKGQQIMVGTGFFKGRLWTNHNHYDCWISEVEQRARDWYFKNAFKDVKMPVDVAAELNRLRSKRVSIIKHGGEPNEVKVKVDEVNQEIALVKSQWKEKNKVK